MLKAYLDVGLKKDKDDEVACVVASVFKPVAYKQFVRPWERMLRKWGASAFHATDFYPGGKEFERNSEQRKQWFEEDSRLIPNLIGTKLTHVIAVSFRPKEFASVASQRWKDRFGTRTHSISVQICMVYLGWWAGDHCPSESFTYFQEAGDEAESDVAEGARRLRQDAEYGPQVRIQSFSSVGKGRARGLEASDFVAWHWNKHYMDRMRRGPRKDWSAFLEIARDKVFTAFVTGEKLKTFLSICDKP